MLIRTRQASSLIIAALVSISMCSCTALRQGASKSDLPAPPPQRVITAQAPKSMVQPASANDVVRISKVAPVPPATRTAVFSPAEPRVELDDSKFQRVAFQDKNPYDDLGPTNSDLYPDEYIFDGGDRDNPVRYGLYNRQGLDTEDTVVEFQDDEGKRFTRSTNRVAIYAPRFGSLRTVSLPTGSHSIDKLASTQDRAVNSGVSSRVASTLHIQREGGKGIRVRSRVSGVDAKMVGSTVDATVHLGSRTKLLNAYEDVGTQKRGSFKQADEASLNLGIEAAYAWSGDQRTVITAVNESLGESYSSSTAAQFVGLEVDHKSKGNLRILKLADKKIAKQGDEITFTIVYANTGDLDLNNIRIVDNLTPRLEYIEDSAGSDRPGRITTQDNEEGSLVLIFELDGPLPGHTTGEISFKCRVR